MLALSALLSACSVSSAARDSPSPGVPTTGSASTTTTTTLPSPVSLAETAPSGAASFLGPIERVGVALLGPGAPVVAPPAAGLPGYLERVSIGFRQFGSGAPLVLLEGQDASMSWWSPELLHQLSASYQVTIFDLPGVGYSGPLPAAAGRTGASVSTDAAATAGLIGALGLVQPTLLGWGLGGQVALAVAEQHPGVVSHLVLVDTGAGGSLQQRSPRSVTALLATFPATPRALAPLLFPATATAPSTSTTTARPSPTPPSPKRLTPAARRWLASIAAVAPDVVIRATVLAEAAAEAAFAESSAVARDLPAVTIPALVVCGAADTVFACSDSTRLADRLEAARLVVVAGAGYGLIDQDPSKLAGLVQSFLG